MPAVTLKLRTGQGGRHTDTSEPNNLPAVVRQLVTEVQALNAIFDAHKHSFDGTAAADSISGAPVTGATTGSATGGVVTALPASVITIET